MREPDGPTAPETPEPPHCSEHREHREPAGDSGPGTGAQARTLLVTGAGGAGRTTVAAASAVSAARDGRATLLLSDEEPSVLEALLGMPDGAVRGDGPVAVPGTDGRLYVARVASAEHFRRAAVSLQESGRKALEMLGSDPLDEDELTELPGSAAFALLSAVRAAHRSADWETVVVDLPPAAEALRTLALPGQLRRYLRRLLPAERQAARALRPALAQLVGVPMPTDALYSGAARWDNELADVQALLESSHTVARLVAEPGPLAAEALRLGRAGLGLYALELESVVANRVVPTGSRDAWAASLSERQQTALKAWHGEYEAESVPVYELPHLGREPRGVDDLELLASQAPAEATPDAGHAPGGDEPGEAERRTPRLSGASGGGADGVVEDRIADEGLLVWRLTLPAVRKEELELVRRGDELVLGFGPYRRILPLPSALRRCRVVGASLDRGELRVRWAPDPALWPGGGTAGTAG